MTHKKYHRIRFAAMLCSTAVMASLLAFGIISLLRAEDPAAVFGKAAPALIAAGIAALILILLFGRIFCGFLCPLGLFQDAVWKATEKLHLPKLSRSEKFMKVMNLFNRIFLVFFLCGILSLTVILAFFPEILRGVRIPLFVLFIVASVMLVLNSFARRLFCNVCPIGSFIGLFERFSVIKRRKDSASCTMCGACYEACPMRIKSTYTETEKADISSSRCLYCGECVKKCPRDHALSITAFGKTVYQSSEEDFLNRQFSDITVKSKGGK